MVEHFRQKINIVWFKRDFRLTDHAPLAAAIDSELPILLLGFLEPSLMQAPQSDIRHWRFVRQSADDINEQLRPGGHELFLLHCEVLDALKAIETYFDIKNIYSHEEVGIRHTYDRDKKVKEYCGRKGISWLESPYAGVIRGIAKRKNWPKHWYSIMQADQIAVNLKELLTVAWPADLVRLGDLSTVAPEITEDHASFQKGGETRARRYLCSFWSERVAHYNTHISKPQLSRKSCSRLSPYLAWGNLSIRQVYQSAATVKKESKHSWHINSFMSRLRWHCHFIQKFEMMDRYETENINQSYDELRTEWNEEKYQRWLHGETGYPLIDACMKCLHHTGYINFRMRSMIVSFLTHHLWLHWKRGADDLARLFLDFEPGIHYPQFQMQAGTTGYNTVRIYNPVKQSLEHDAEGEFIKTWLPQLAGLPLHFVHEPWKMTAMDQQIYDVQLGEQYPLPIVNIEASYRNAQKTLWSFKKRHDVRKRARQLLTKQDEENRPID